MNVAIWLLTGPPLILAWRLIQNHHRLSLYLFYLLALPVFVFFVVGIVLENMIVRQRILSDTIWGMPYLVLLTEALAYLGYQLYKQHLWLRDTRIQPTPVHAGELERHVAPHSFDP
jgi:hypothetical protein